MKNSEVILLILGVLMLCFTAIAAAIVKETSIAFLILIGTLIMFIAIIEYNSKKK